MYVYFIPLTVNLTKNSKLEKFVHELNALWKLSGSSMGALRELVPVAGVFITFLHEKWLFVPLANDWHCVNAHDCIALHILQPLFIIPSDSSHRRRMNTGYDSPGRIKCRPIEALVVSATHKSPSQI